MNKRPFWVSWWYMSEFELHSPWWISGERGDGVESVCAAVMATSEDDARACILAAHDVSGEIEWRFAEERPADWAPFCDRFPRANWMVWP